MSATYFRSLCLPFFVPRAAWRAGNGTNGKKLDEDCSGHGQKEAVDGNGGARGRGSGCLRKSRYERDKCEKDQKLKFLEFINAHPKKMDINYTKKYEKLPSWRGDPVLRFKV